MSRKDYKAIAKAVADSTMFDNRGLIDKGILISKLCEVFRLENGRFDAIKFADACVYKELGV